MIPPYTLATRNSNYLNYIIQEDLDNLNTWFKLNSLTLNIQKSSVMEFLPEQKQTNPNLVLKIDNSELLKTNTTKFLGVIIDNNLSWQEHISNVIKKVSTNKLLIGKSRNFLSTAAKHNIYYVHIHSHLQYANAIWSGQMKSKQRINIEKIQNYCVRAIMNKPRKYHTDPLFTELKIMKIKEIEHFKHSKLGFCIKENLLPHPILKMFYNYGKKIICTTQEIKIYLTLKNTKVKAIIRVFCVKAYTTLVPSKRIYGYLNRKRSL